MQVKPRFETYKILEQYTVLKDDTGNELCLSLLEVKLPSTEDEIIDSTYKFWTVIGKIQKTWGNKAISYESFAFYKDPNKKNLFKGIVNGFIVEEKEFGQHYVDDVNVGLKTKFIITPPLDQSINPSTHQPINQKK